VPIVFTIDGIDGAINGSVHKLCMTVLRGKQGKVGNGKTCSGRLDVGAYTFFGYEEHRFAISCFSPQSAILEGFLFDDCFR